MCWYGDELYYARQNKIYVMLCYQLMIKTFFFMT